MTWSSLFGTSLFHCCKCIVDREKTRALGECRLLLLKLNSLFPLYFLFLLIVIWITPNFFMDPDSDPDHYQHLITCSLSHLGHILKISSKSLHNFLSYLSLKLHFMDPEDPDDPDHSQNLITSSFYHFGHILKI